MGEYFTPFSLRIDEQLLAKLKYIAGAEKRSLNKQMEFVLERFVREYEQTNGEIEIEQLD